MKKGAEVSPRGIFGPVRSLGVTGCVYTSDGKLWDLPAVGPYLNPIVLQS